MASTIPVRKPGLSVTTSNLLLPPGFPELPQAVKDRFPEMEAWHEEMLQWWRSTSQALLESNRQNSTSISQNYAAIQDAFRRLGLIVTQDDNGLVVRAGTFDSQFGYKVQGTQVVGPQGAAVANATGAGDVVAQLNALLARVRTHGLIAP